ncbi:hypothetical protein [Exiguobacterium artemiae]|uniref:hypothetical protein n=1 Tax=Exiguobacterium artemiae TaxID=340145 RepID=UPI0029644438|nr:hypothetical protein [Exiguobacterium sibiricum]MDW2887177.1 hypothetical protein [Exiguobacterium sibiricum]
MATEENIKRINIRMPLPIYEWVQEQSDYHGVSVTAYLNMKISEIKKQEDMMKAMAVMTNENVLKYLEKKAEE